jgi:hypothetical protein
MLSSKMTQYFPPSPTDDKTPEDCARIAQMYTAMVDLRGESDGYESDEPTPAQRARWAEVDAALAERRKLGVVDGRDWTGVWVAPHLDTCVCEGCQPYVAPNLRESEDYLRCQSLFGTEQAEYMLQSRAGVSWYDMFFPDGYDPEWDAAMEAYRAARDAVPEEVRLAREAAERLAEIQKRKEEKAADEAKMRLSREQLKSGLKMVKNGRLCTRLYSCVGDKASGGARPTTMHVSSECWSHERVCPQTGALLTPHKCPFLHPGEPGWHAEWAANRLWQPAAAPAAPAQAVRVWTPENLFSAAAGGSRPAQSGSSRPAAGGQRPAQSGQRPAAGGGWEKPKRR